MTAKTARKSSRRQPKQRRSRQTVDAILEAVIRLLKRSGSNAITTNRIAEIAGVSIGSVYQYFSNKRAIFVALHQRHVDSIDRMIQGKVVQYAAAPLKDLVRALVEGMVEAHETDPELYGVLFEEVPHRADGTQEFAVRLHSVFRLAIAARAHEVEMKKRRDLDKVVFVVTHMVDALSHGAVLRRPPGLSLAEAKEEAVKAVLAYLTA
jgi:AcrR family transcriptional regulator